MPHRSSKRPVNACALAIACLALGCTSPRPQAPTIGFTHLPPAGEGSPDILFAIEGKVKNALPGQKVVLFAHSGVWWVQPLADQPFTPIQRDSTWKTSTHPGLEYAALLVDANYHPTATVNALPAKGDGVAAVVTAAGAAFDLVGAVLSHADLEHAGATTHDLLQLVLSVEIEPDRNADRKSVV